MHAAISATWRYRVVELIKQPRPLARQAACPAANARLPPPAPLALPSALRCGTGIPSELYRKGELCGACVRMWCVDSICENALGEPGSMQQATLVAVKAGAVGPCLLLL
jgi:hypothetical protein